ncbi:MAG: Aspartyl-tRNA synthetase @ Aspartyl-tRNA(Asn) synthetase [uncultured Frankineae bacterium]|uniref:Aspartate--tRNA(Asp/Asn) ligase n=1 Tax=uncultured Frankineae bacterium TaxID=437475 RepID=A0A6J4LHG8_9ACTN|nr:MAG: Aspartyl-tRNA synthetase @ Aspartyl-tRNA(Asn) synthetase [uncultured Frankineae bacterium]
MIRTHEAGTLREEHAGTDVTLTGWVARRRDHGGVAFLDLRDGSGVVQVVVRESLMQQGTAAHDLRAEYCVRVAGEVRVRPEGNRNDALPTGAVEVAASEVEVLSAAAPLPFPIDDDATIGEEARLRYRYLDLRRPSSASALRTRSRVTRAIRRVMDERDFLDIETPTLTRSTPEGARDFLVPVRLQPGHWYALPQSPQLFKQLLMVAGMERYYQIARCYRDEDFRADRQPEFTQLDIEMSFPDEEDLYELTEAVMARIWSDVLDVAVPTPFPRMTYDEAMRRFGVDRPDVRFGLELVDLTPYFSDTPFRVFQAPHVGAVVMPGGASQPRKTFDAWQEWAKQRGARGLAYVTFLEDGTLGGPVAKNLSESEREGLREAVGAQVGDCAFFAAGARTDALALLGATRLEVGRRQGLMDDSRWEFLWVTDFPMFEAVTDSSGAPGGWTAVHHPFTAPAKSHEDTFAKDPADVPARAYDLILNGTELGGGSIRIHSSEVQKRVFDVIGLTPEQASEQFGFLLEAFAYGPPPHGGIAFGIDRIAAMITGSESIREVIAFPKTGGGGDPLTGAPTPITAQQRKEAGIDVSPTS